MICGDDVNHIRNVLRMKIGERLLISDGEDREYVCAICEIGKDCVVAEIEDVNGPQRELSIQVTLFQALPKGDKMETIIQKMVELGVFQIVPVSTKRGETVKAGHCAGGDKTGLLHTGATMGRTDGYGAVSLRKCRGHRLYKRSIAKNQA